MASNGKISLAEAPVDESGQSFEYIIKLLLVGSSGVGKTCFLNRYTQGRDAVIRDGFVATVGIDFKVKTITKYGKRIRLQIWDTAGQERYRAITTAYYRGAMGFVLMYDIADELSFTAVQEWSTAIKSHSWDNSKVILVGNKVDRDDRKVTKAKGQQLADILGYSFMEASAKRNYNVNEAFNELVRLICDKMAETLHQTRFTKVKDISKSPEDKDKPEQSGCSC